MNMLVKLMIDVKITSRTISYKLIKKNIIKFMFFHILIQLLSHHLFFI